MGTKNDQTMIHCLIWKIDGRNELDKISFDRIECPSLSRSAYCASPCVCVYVCFLRHFDKVGGYIAADVITTMSIHDRFSMQTQNCATRSVVVAVIVAVVVIIVVVDVCSQLAVRFRPSTADKRGVAFERKCESCIASRNRKRKGKFSTKGHIHHMYEQIQRGGVPSESLTDRMRSDR